MHAQTNGPYSDRVQLICDSIIGPLTQDGPLAEFDPRRDLEVYVDGDLIPVRTFSFDTLHNRYLLFLEQTFNLQGIIQLVHHMPSPAFRGAPVPIVQQFKFFGVSANTFTFTIPQNITKGNQLLLAVELAVIDTAPAIGDNLGLTWNQISFQQGGSGPSDPHSFTVFAAPVTVTGSDTVTITTTSSADICVIGLELQTVGSIQTTSPVNDTGTSTSWPSVSITVPQKSILIALDVGYAPPAVIADDFVLIDTQLVGSPPVQLSIASKIVGPGVYTSHWTQASSAEWQTVLVGYPIIPSTVGGFALLADFFPSGDLIGWGTSWGSGFGQS